MWLFLYGRMLAGVVNKLSQQKNSRKNKIYSNILIFILCNYYSILFCVIFISVIKYFILCIRYMNYYSVLFCVILILIVIKN